MCMGVQDPTLLKADKFKGTATDSGGTESDLSGPAPLASLAPPPPPGGTGLNPLSGSSVGEKPPASSKPFAGSGMAGETSSGDYGNWSMPDGGLEHLRPQLVTAKEKESLARMTKALGLPTGTGSEGIGGKTGSKGIGVSPSPGVAGAQKAGGFAQPLKTGLLTQPVKSVVPGEAVNATQPEAVLTPSVPQPKAEVAPKTEPEQPPAGPGPQSDAQQWVNPTEGGIRNDDQGKGDYGERRDGGSRTHRGVDYAGKAGDPVRAPFDGTLEIVPDGVRITQPGSKEGPRYSARMLHFDPSVQDRVQVKAGQVIGNLQDLSKTMHEDMTPHVHFEAYELDKQGNAKNVDPTSLIPIE